MHEPRFEIGTNTAVAIYNGTQFQESGGNPGNQTGRMLFYKGASQGSWSRFYRVKVLAP